MSSEQFDQILQLQQSVEELQKSLEIANSQKNLANKKFKEIESTFTRSQLELTQQKETVKKLKEEVRVKDVKITQLDDENKNLERSSLVSSMRKGKGESSKDMATEDTLDRIIVLENELAIEKDKSKLLQKEIKTLQLTIQQKDKAISLFDDQAKKGAMSGNSKEQKIFDIEAQNSALKVEIEELKSQIKTLNHMQKMKTETIEKLLKKINSLKEVFEINDEKKKEIEAKDREIERLKQEVQIAKKSADNKDKEINTIAKSKDVTAINSLEHDKRYLFDELKKKTEKITAFSKTINAQQKQIEILNKRIESLLYTVSLKESPKVDGEQPTEHPAENNTQNSENQETLGSGTGSDENQSGFAGGDTVPAKMFDLLQKGNTLLRKQKKNLETLMEEKDEMVETLEKKVDVLKKQQSTQDRKNKKKEAEMEKQIEDFRAEIAKIEADFKNKEVQLKKEKIAVQKKVNKLNQSVNMSVQQ